jgi:dihydroorotate dehydrogenase
VLISAGGVSSPADVVERLRAGATLVQAYTGFVYGGPLWPARLHRGVARLVREAGFESVADLGRTAVPAA